MTRHTTAAPAAPGFFRSVLKPLILSFLITLLSLGLLAALIALGPVTEKAADYCILLSTVLSIFIGAFRFSRIRQSRGLWAGLIFGALYMVFAFCVAWAGFGKISPEVFLLKRLPQGLFSGALGGIMGVNIRKKRR